MTLAHSGVAFLDLVPKMAVGDEDESYRWCGSRCNEFEVGIRALSRSPSFHPGEDNIVRTYARMLRKRLEEYFETEGREAFGRTHIRWHRARASPGRREHGGSQAAADFVMNESAMAPILVRSRRRDGSIGPFELLLETRTVGASTPEARAIVERHGILGSTE
jgi:hypothetical protein